MDVLKKLKASRTAYQGHLTRVLNEIYAVSTETITSEQVRALLERLAAAATNTREVSEAIVENLVDESEVTEEIQGQLETSDSVIIAQVKLESIKDELKRKVENDAVQDNLSMSNHSDSSNILQYSGLPKLVLPTFSGDPFEWRPFLDQFNASVHCRQIPKIQKFTYLWSALRDEARDVIKGLSKTDANYDEALTILKNRFGDPSFLLGLYADRISGLPYVEEDDNKSFRSLIDTFENSLRELNNLLNEATEDGTLQIPVHELFCASALARRLPASVYKEWLRRTEKPVDRFQLKNLLDFAKREVDSSEIIQTRISTSKSSSAEIHNEEQLIHHPPMSTASVLKVSSKKVRACRCCSATGHRIYKCPSFLGLSSGSRLHLCEEKKLCQNCLANHPSALCPSNFTCHTCGQAHHSLLHDFNSQSQNQPNAQPQNQSNPQPQCLNQNPSTSEVHKVEELEQRQAVLQTALVEVKGVCRPVRILLDSGAEHSYITESLADRAKPRLIEKCSRQFEGFGGLLSFPRKCSTFEVEFRSYSTNNWHHVKLVAVPMICRPPDIINPASIRAVLKPFSFPLADVYDGSLMPIDIIFGLDALPQISLPQPPIQANRLLITPTKLGYVLGGTIPSSNKSSSSFTAISRVLRSSNIHDVSEYTPQPSSSTFSGGDPMSRLWKLDAIIGKSPDRVRHVRRLYSSSTPFGPVYLPTRTGGVNVDPKSPLWNTRPFIDPETSSKSLPPCTKSTQIDLGGRM